MMNIVAGILLFFGSIVVAGGILALMDTHKNEKRDIDELRKAGLL